MTEGARFAPLCLEGWYVLHQGFRISWPGLRRHDADERAGYFGEFADTLRQWEDLGDDGWTGSYRMVGGGMDYMLIHFRSSLEGLADAERDIQLCRLGDHLHLVFDYVSVVELGLYRTTSETVRRLRQRGVDPGSAEGREALRAAADEERNARHVQERLHPRQPENMPYVSFYPMDKRRRPGQNWYALPLERRSELMAAHGDTGRRYADRVSQVITGSIGLDDWEWAVTLFAPEPLDFKELVTEMRFDEVSAEYAEFGPFYVGRRIAPDAWERLLVS